MDTRSRFHNALARGHVPELIRLRMRPVLNQRGQPIVIGGNDAVVARMMRSDGAMRALRIPVLPESGNGWNEHYGAVIESLPRSAVDWVPRDIEVLERGITLDTGTMPAILMEWIDGQTLLQATDRAASYGNTAVLVALAEALKDLAGGLRQSHVVHGDLAADNLIVRTDGRVAAVDLDTLSWPNTRSVVKGQRSQAYRSPGVDATFAQQDAFAVLVQYVSLVILADAPRLRLTFGETPATHGGAMVFSAWDLADPTSSRAFRDVRDQVDGEARRMLDLLRDACLGDASQLPEILAAAFNPSSSHTFMDSDTPPRPGPQTMRSGWDLSQVIDRLRNEDEVTVREETPEPEPFPGLPVFGAPDDVEEERSRLREAIDAGHDADIVRYAVNLANDPIFRMYKLDIDRALANGFASRIADAVRQNRDDLVIRLADEAAERKLPLDQTSRRSIRAARERNEVRDKLEHALNDNDRAALADLAVSGELVVLGDTDRASLTRVLQALEWPNLQRALESDDDTLILESFDQELFDRGASLPANARTRVTLARQRVTWIANVRKELKQRNVDALADLSSKRPQGGMERLGRAERERVDRLVRRKVALDGLQNAVRAGNDARVLARLHDVEKSGARIEDPLMWTTVQRVVERASLVERILDAASASPVDDRALAHLLPVARSMGLVRDPAFHDDHSWDALQAMVVRGAAVRRIRRALATDDDQMMRQIAYSDISGAIDDLTPEERARIDLARRRRVVS